MARRPPELEQAGGFVLLDIPLGRNVNFASDSRYLTFVTLTTIVDLGCVVSVVVVYLDSL